MPKFRSTSNGVSVTTSASASTKEYGPPGRKARDSPPPATRTGSVEPSSMSGRSLRRMTSTSPKVWTSPGTSLSAPCLSTPWRTTSAPMPRRVSPEASPAWSAAMTPSSPRMASGGTSGMASRTAHGTSSSGWSGSSRVQPQSSRAKERSGKKRVRVPCAWALRKSAASCQYCGTASYAPRGKSRPVNAGLADAPTTSATATSAVARCPELRWRLSAAQAKPMPSASGRRTSGSNLWTLRSAAPEPSRKSR